MGLNSQYVKVCPGLELGIPVAELAAAAEPTRHSKDLAWRFHAVHFRVKRENGQDVLNCMESTNGYILNMVFDAVEVLDGKDCDLDFCIDPGPFLSIPNLMRKRNERIIMTLYDDHVDIRFENQSSCPMRVSCKIFGVYDQSIHAKYLDTELIAAKINPGEHKVIALNGELIDILNRTAKWLGAYPAYLTFYLSSGHNPIYVTITGAEYFASILMPLIDDEQEALAKFPEDPRELARKPLTANK